MTSVAHSAKTRALIHAIDEVLPQTQCTACGYPACRPYAEAMAQNEAPIHLCEPGGETLIATLAALTREPVRPAYHPPLKPQVAQIREIDCIGCARCLPACPVDAILGARKFLHTVLMDECTGCKLCIDPCPVDCIELVDRPIDHPAPSARENRERFESHQARRRERQNAHQHALDKATRRAALIEKAREARLRRRGNDSL